jgi:hypothetical protein
MGAGIAALRRDSMEIPQRVVRQVRQKAFDRIDREAETPEKMV